MTALCLYEMHLQNLSSWKRR